MSEYDTFGNDVELVNALKAGDNRALQVVYDRCFRSFESYVAICGGNSEDARDCFQEGILSVWVNVKQGRYQLQENAAFRTYVLGVCKYKWMNKLRSAHHKKVTLTEEMPEIVEIPSDDQYEEQLQILNAGLVRLGEGCQQILRMFYFEKMSYEEMGKHTGKTPDSLKNQKYRCIMMLKELVSSKEN
jgi:RNA polymerase sigma factor (sigma-70 family)